MHLNKILEQLKRHTNPSEAIGKMGRALSKHERVLLEEDGEKYRDELCIDMYEAINGPHFDEEHARLAVGDMQNEDGSKGPHWTVEETTSVASQYGINLKSEEFNKWDWFVAMNMMWSDYYKAVVSMTGNSNVKSFAELAKAWLSDKDISEGKMWHYYAYIMNDDEDEDELMEYHRHKQNRNYDKYGERNRHEVEYYNSPEYDKRDRESRERNPINYREREREKYFDGKPYETPETHEKRNTSVRYF